MRCVCGFHQIVSDDVGSIQVILYYPRGNKIGSISKQRRRRHSLPILWPSVTRNGELERCYTIDICIPRMNLVCAVAAWFCSVSTLFIRCKPTPPIMFFLLFCFAFLLVFLFLYLVPNFSILSMCMEFLYKANRTFARDVTKEIYYKIYFLHRYFLSI